MKRITKEEYYYGIASAVSMRSTCMRRRYGAVIVKNDEIIATGYNGSPRGLSNCVDTGECIRDTKNIPSGERYEECCAVHAEANAINSASRRYMLDGDLYLAGFEQDTGKPTERNLPCKLCRLLLLNSGIKNIYIFGMNSKGEIESDTITRDDLKGAWR